MLGVKALTYAATSGGLARPRRVRQPVAAGRRPRRGARRAPAGRPVAHRYAQPELKLAQAKLARAEQAMTREDWRAARRLAEQAEVDARYAWALAESERVRAER